MHCRSGKASCAAGDGLLGGPARRERAEVGRAVVAQLAHEGEPREGLDGELDPDHALGEPRAPVVVRLVRGDQPQLADLGLEGGRARDVAYVLREPTISAIRVRVSLAVK